MTTVEMCCILVRMMSSAVARLLKIGSRRGFSNKQGCENDVMHILNYHFEFPHSQYVI